MSVDLVVVIPVFNEENAIVSVLAEWRAELSARPITFRLLVVDDGSTDSTPVRLRELRWPELELWRHENRGHGQSCLAGYREAARLGAKYVFQIDSDGQCDPAFFAQLWAVRDESRVIYGRRVRRDDGLSRRIVTVVLRLFLKALMRTRLNDTNVPFRLYDARLAAEVAQKIPPTFDLANIAMALLMEPFGFREIPIHFRDRVGGHASVRWWGFGKKALRLRRDLKSLSNA